MFDYVPEQRERWLRVRERVNVVNEPEKLTKIQDYLSRLSAPKLSVHVGEHVGGANTR